MVSAQNSREFELDVGARGIGHVPTLPRYHRPSPRPPPNQCRNTEAGPRSGNNHRQVRKRHTIKNRLKGTCIEFRH